MADVEKKIYFNEDNHHFYLHPAEDMTPAGCRALVDFYAQSGAVKGILFCTNVQRALYDSNVWERFRDIDNPDPLMTNLKLLSKRGVDQFKEWLDRCRELDIEGWLTVRMNDCHGLEECLDGLDVWCADWPSHYWRNNPQLRRAPYRRERSWEGAFNFLCEEVRSHTLKLIEEILGRWDMTGLELDWLRWGMMVPPGFEREAQDILTDFVRKVRSYADEAEKRVGHPIRLAHRIPASPIDAENFGFDVVRWADEGMADMVTLSEFADAGVSDPPVKLWRRLLPEGCVINVHVGDRVNGHPGARVVAHDQLRGTAGAAWSCGADNLYLFNICYMELYDKENLTPLLKEISSPENLQTVWRRTVVAMPWASMPGTPAGNTLPVLLDRKYLGADLTRLDRNITLRLPAGKTGPEAQCYLRLAFSEEVPQEERKLLEEMTVRINTVPLERAAFPQYEAGDIEAVYPYLPEMAAFSFTWRVPASVLHETFNAIEFEPPAVKGEVVWCDLLIKG